VPDLPPQNAPPFLSAPGGGEGKHEGRLLANLMHFARALRAAGLQVLATAVDGETSLDDAGQLLGKPTAWLFGPESRGLSAEIADSADHRVRIPMSGGAESLNVASAAAICLYQSARALGRSR